MFVVPPLAIVRLSRLLLFLIIHMNWGVDHREPSDRDIRSGGGGGLQKRRVVWVVEWRVRVRRKCDAENSILVTGEPQMYPIFRWCFVYFCSISCFLLLFNIHVSFFFFALLLSLRSFFHVLCICMCFVQIFRCMCVCVCACTAPGSQLTATLSFPSDRESFSIQHPVVWQKLLSSFERERTSGAKTPSRDSCVMNRYLPFELDEHFKIKSENERTNKRTNFGSYISKRTLLLTILLPCCCCCSRCVRMCVCVCH